MSNSLDRRLAALEAKALPDQGLRVAVMQEDLQWSPEQRRAAKARFCAGLPEHRGMTVVVRRFFDDRAADPRDASRYEAVSTG
ncbi:hypothetical protein [Acidisoma sp. S159]|uniref:hypothetical protein n=1 Tax=Acidisoma sp. S159 TaxID=1747225 RepID=UPI00131EABC4|nr:hypothetical protein [Acidisoma sp. S159]